MCSYELQWSEAPGKRSKRCVISMSSAQNRSPSDKGERITFIWWIVHELGQSVKHGTVPPHLIILLKKRQMPVCILTHYCIVVNFDSVTAITLYAVWHGLKRCISPLFFFFSSIVFKDQRSSKIFKNFTPSSLSSASDMLAWFSRHVTWTCHIHSAMCANTTAVY